ncbi:MAG: TIGR00180 family glycosyltransferase [Elusimicrobiota bacterium]
MERNKKVSVVIPTKNRSFFLRKTLEYYSLTNFEHQIVIGDASDESFSLANQNEIKKHPELAISYIKFNPDKRITHSMVEMLEKVNTDYSLFSGDDDFFVGSSLSKCADFLDKNPDYSAACGEPAWLYLKSVAEDVVEPIYLKRGPTIGLDGNKPSVRLMTYMSPSPLITTFSLQRTSGILYAWKHASEINLDLNRHYLPLHEISVNVIQIIQGKLKLIPGLYHLMLRHNDKKHDSQGVDDYFDKVLNWDWNHHVRGMIEWWAKQFSQAEGLAYEKSFHFMSALFIRFSNEMLGRYSKRRIKELGFEKNNPAYKKQMRDYLIKVPGLQKAWLRYKGIQQFNLDNFLDPKSRFYNDFYPMYQTLFLNK